MCGNNERERTGELDISAGSRERTRERIKEIERRNKGERKEKKRTDRRKIGNFIRKTRSSLGRSVSANLHRTVARSRKTAILRFSDSLFILWEIVYLPIFNQNAARCSLPLVCVSLTICGPKGFHLGVKQTILRNFATHPQSCALVEASSTSNRRLHSV